MTNVNELLTVSKEEYDPNKQVTLTDLAEAFGVTRITANKRLVKAGVGAVAKLDSGTAGRPPVLFPREAANAALVKQRAKKTRTRVVGGPDAVLDAVNAALSQ